LKGQKRPSLSGVEVLRAQPPLYNLQPSFPPNPRRPCKSAQSCRLPPRGSALGTGVNGRPPQTTIKEPLAVRPIFFSIGGEIPFRVHKPGLSCRGCFWRRPCKILPMVQKILYLAAAQMFFQLTLQFTDLDGFFRSKPTNDCPEFGETWSPRVPELSLHPFLQQTQRMGSTAHLRGGLRGTGRGTVFQNCVKKSRPPPRSTTVFSSNLLVSQRNEIGCV